MNLPRSFLDRPIAHRALHDAKAGRPENSMSAIVAAVDAGYGIEIDLQPSSDHQAMVFHDAKLDRLTGSDGPILAQSASTLAGIHLTGTDEGIPTLSKVLDVINGQVPLLIEIKDQDGALGPNVGMLEAATAAALEGYTGDVAVMSFNPWSVLQMSKLAPDIPRGIVTMDYTETTGGNLDAAERARLTEIPDYDRVGACFISHNHKDLTHPRVAELKGAGARILCWTIRSPEEEATAREIVDNVTFEGYLA